MSNLEGVSQVVTRGSTLPQFDYRCPLLSLPLAFKTTLDSIPSPSKYLNSDATKVEQWKTRFVDKDTATDWVGVERQKHASQ